MEDEIPDFDLDRFSDEGECSDSDGSTNTISDNSAPVEKSVAIEGIEYHWDRSNNYAYLHYFHFWG